MYCTIHGPYGILWFCPLFWWVAIHCLERGWQNWWVFIHLFFCDVDTTLISHITFQFLVGGFQYFIYSPRTLGKIPILTSIFFHQRNSAVSITPFYPNPSTHRENPHPTGKTIPQCRGFTSSYRHMTCRKPGGCGTLEHWKDKKTWQYLCKVGPLVVIKGGD